MTSLSRPAVRRHGRIRRICVGGLIALTLLGLGGCSSLSSWIPSIPVPSFGWLFGSSKKPPPLPEIKTTVSPQIIWETSIGKAAPGLAPAVTADAIYSAANDGGIQRSDPATGRTVWRVSAPGKLSAGVGADASTVAVGTSKGDVYAFDAASGKSKWQVKVSSEVISPPRIADGLVVVWSGDGRLYALNAEDGKTKWVYQRENPPLIVRNTAGGVLTRGALFTGTAGGKLLALDLSSGSVAWEGNVATPKGATELERIADITSLPVLDASQGCAVAYQGRVACFDLLRGTMLWSRELSSLGGLAIDDSHIYVTDDQGAIVALDKTTGGSVWKQDKLSGRKPSGPVLIGSYVGVVDVEGYLHILSRDDGSLVGRSATDGSPATAQPTAVGANALWQSTAGNLLLVGLR